MNAARTFVAHLAVLLGAVAAAGAGAAHAGPAAAAEHPLLAQLRAETARGDGAAMERFWDAVRSAGTPLLAPVPGEPASVAATFLWRGDAAGGELALIASFVPGGSRQALRFLHLAGTDVWHVGLAVPADGRYRYYLARPQAGDAEAAGDSALEIDGVRWELFADPLSRLTYVDESDGRPVPTSYLEGPDAPAEPWLERRPGAPSGALVTLEVASAALGNSRNVTVYLPPGYRPRPEGHPYLLLFDGRQYLSAVPTPTILDNLIGAGAIPPMIAIFVDSLGEAHRDRELAPNPAFATFVTTELLPRVSRDYPLSRDPAEAVVAGSSLGGLAASTLALRYPGVFGNVLSQSGSYWWYPGVHEDADEAGQTGWLVREYVAAERLPLRFYLDVGRGEGEGMLRPNRLFRDMLAARGYTVFYREFEGDHSYLNWRGTLADGLTCLLGGPGAGACAAPPAAATH